MVRKSSADCRNFAVACAGHHLQDENIAYQHFTFLALSELCLNLLAQDQTVFQAGPVSSNDSGNAPKHGFAQVQPTITSPAPRSVAGLNDFSNMERELGLREARVDSAAFAGRSSLGDKTLKAIEHHPGRHHRVAQDVHMEPATNPENYTRATLEEVKYLCSVVWFCIFGNASCLM